MDKITKLYPKEDAGMNPETTPGNNSGIDAEMDSESTCTNRLLTDEEIETREKIKNNLIEELIKNEFYNEISKDLVERYLKLHETALMLEKDIECRGVSILTKTGFKKNDSVSLLVNTNKQMGLMLEKMGVSASKIKKSSGGDI